MLRMWRTWSSLERKVLWHCRATGHTDNYKQILSFLFHPSSSCCMLSSVYPTQKPHHVDHIVDKEQLICENKITTFCNETPLCPLTLSAVAEKTWLLVADADEDVEERGFVLASSAATAAGLSVSTKKLAGSLFPLPLLFMSNSSLASSK